MAVAFEMRFEGGTLEQYDQVIALMGYEHDGTIDNDGGVYHWVAKTDDGIVVVDVWESDEQFERFAEEQIGPFSAQVGLGKPTMKRYEVYNTLASEKLVRSRV